jgi:polygalacturonase
MKSFEGDRQITSIGADPLQDRSASRGAVKRALSINWQMMLMASCLGTADVSAQSLGSGCEVLPTSKMVIDVRVKGAKGDGSADDTAAIQKAIDEVAGTGGTVVVPDGIYMVNALAPSQLTLKSRMTLKLSAGATLKAIPNSSKEYTLLMISGVSHVTVTGGALEGDREQHQGNSGEWGMGIRIVGGAENITIRGVTAKKMWGDGFYLDGAKDVYFCSVVADHNRRQGLSIIEADGVLVTNSVFKNTHGTRPSAGIDLEPDREAQVIRNIIITRSKFLDNAGAGIQVLGKKGASNVSNVQITNNLFRGVPPVKIKYAEGILDSAICRNRYTVRREPPHDLAMIGSKSQEVVILAACGDPGLRIRY